jgi:hypothetical protein
MAGLGLGCLLASIGSMVALISLVWPFWTFVIEPVWDNRDPTRLPMRLEPVGMSQMPLSSIAAICSSLGTTSS